MGLLLALVLSAFAASTYVVESRPVESRSVAEQLVVKLQAAGIPAHVVRRFRLGHGWEFVLLVDGLPAEADAQATAARLRDEFGLAPSILRLDEGGKTAAAPTAAPSAETKARTAADWIADAVAAHGGASGGARRLSMASSVHVVYERTARLEGKDATVRHDYWRIPDSRRLKVDTQGSGVDSVAVLTPKGAWVLAGGAVTSRDIGVLLETVDAFAPEAVLTVALDVAPLLAEPEVARFSLLEGAEGVVRLGAGSDQGGLSYVDLDPATRRVVRVRYVTEGGPIEWELRGWREVSPGVLVPAEVRIERADGRIERIRVVSFEVGATPPEGTFTAPTVAG